ncbi:MAG: acetolactate synthase [Solirubrobacteraceae bacterium]|nr:acetolactate synthase [Solirubrobacteraceae bacterium]
MSNIQHGGRLTAARLAAHGTSTLFTLSGGHLFSIYDGTKSEGIRLIDVRHEQTAAFAAEGWAKVTREPGVAALTAGPGVTNGMSAMGSALTNRSPMVVLGGRAPAMRWGQGSLQEIDHLPFVSPLTRYARTVEGPADIQPSIDAAFAAAQGPPGGPAFVDISLDHVFTEAEPDTSAPAPVAAEAPVDGASLEQAIALLRGAERPVVMAGTDLYWARAEHQLVAFAEALRTPVFTNGQARGCIPADHELAFSRVRSQALKGADVALVVGVPMDFRLGFGGSFGPDTKIITLQRAAFDASPPRTPEIALVGDIAAALASLTEGVAGTSGHDAANLASLRESETAAREAQRADLTSNQVPLHPMRIYGDLVDVLGRDAIVICDGGDFASYAGQVVDRYEPGTWLDPGPFGCLGAGPGYALAAKLAHPDREVVILYGDGAFGFSAIEFDTLVRHGVHVVGVMGNNGIWALEKHPMEFIYGYSLAAELTPETRYDQLVEALGGTGELVREPGAFRPALEKALGGNSPTLLNVLTDPETKYPRKANLG